MLITIAYLRGNEVDEQEIQQFYEQLILVSSSFPNLIIGNIYCVTVSCEDIESAISNMMQQQESIQKQTPGIRQLLLILQISQKEQKLQDTFQTQAQHSNLVFSSGKNFFQNKKINQLNPLNHNYMTMMPLSESVDQRKRAEKVKIDIVSLQEYPQNEYLNYFYYLALQEGYARSIYVTAAQCDIRFLKDRRKQMAQILLRVTSDMVSLLQKQY